MFLGDHTRPDHPGYVAVIREVLTRFHTQLNLNLISAGGPGQTAKGLNSGALRELLTSSRPDWLIIGIGLSDALREPEARRLLEEYRRGQKTSPSDADEIFGPEVRARNGVRGPVNDVGRKPEPTVHNLASFTQDYVSALDSLAGAGVRCCSLTTIMLGNESANPVNGVLRAYNKAIKQAASDQGALLGDVERAFRDIFDRAANYKQQVALTGITGALNAQGEALVARTVLQALDLLPQPGHRPPRSS
jgi:lysophospholipase L1-like esterase